MSHARYISARRIANISAVLSEMENSHHRRYIRGMKPHDTSLDDKLEGTGSPVERGYEAWKRDKILRGLDQARDRHKMIPAEQLWRDLGFER